LEVITLAKETDFYYQKDIYQKSPNFIADITEQMKNPKDFGYNFDLKSQKKLQEWIIQLIPILHQAFFDGKKQFSQREKLDYIELMYYFIILKALELDQPTSLSLTCKDGVDTSAAMSAGFYLFLKLLGESGLTGEDKEFIRWLVYAPALYVRERAIDSERVSRMASALSHMEKVLEKKRKEVQALVQPLFSTVFKGLKLFHQ